MDIRDTAISKLESEAKALTKLSKYESAVKSAVIDALICFCQQNEEFAAAVCEGDKELKGALSAAVKGCGSSISDLEVFRRAAGYYFNGCTVKFNMRIYMSKYDADDTDEARGLYLNLDDLL